MLPEQNEQIAEPAEIRIPEENPAAGDPAFELLDEPPFNELGKKGKDKVSESRKEVEKTYRAHPVYTPLRFLALPPLHKNEKIPLDDFDRLRDAVIRDETLEHLPRHRSRTTDAEMVARACHLLFALVESGGLATGSPEEEIERLKISCADARFGFLKPVRKLAKNKKKNSDIELDEETENDFDDEPSDEILDQNKNENSENELFESKPVASGIRWSLYALGRIHLAAFVRFRIVKQKASDGDALLPKLEIGREQFREIVKHLPWLENIPNKLNLTWQSVFRHWLKVRLRHHGERRGRVTWSDVARVASWRIFQRERYPFLVAARRHLFQSVPLPDEKFAAVFALALPQFVRREHSPLPANRETVETGVNFSQDDLKTGIETDDDDFESELAVSRDDAANEDRKMTNFGFVNRLLSDLKQSGEKKKVLVKKLKSEANSPHLKGSGETDLRHLLLWTAESVKNKKFSTAYTYAVRVLRALFSMPQIGFADWQTSDVAEYLENYATNASVKNVRTALRLFDEFLVGQNAAAENHIHWRSRSLQSPVTFAARDVISNREYERVRNIVCEDAGREAGERLKLRNLSLLTLLRRAGLRVGEAAALTPRNFTGFKKWCLTITKSKTRAGLRKLPLYLLLDKNEIGELKRFVEMRAKKGGLNGSLFVDEKDDPLAAHALGRIAGKLLKLGDIEGETAHGLRHAFASSLFAAFWLNLTAGRRKGNQSNPFLRALKEYARPKIEGRAATEPIYMQQLLGHADLRVTFERYVHLIELAGADAVRLSEVEENGEQAAMKARHAAYLIGMDVRLLTDEFDGLPNDFIHVIKVAELASMRTAS